MPKSFMSDDSPFLHAIAYGNTDYVRNLLNNPNSMLSRKEEEWGDRAPFSPLDLAIALEHHDIIALLETNDMNFRLKKCELVDIVDKAASEIDIFLEKNDPEANNIEYFQGVVDLWCARNRADTYVSGAYAKVMRYYSGNIESLFFLIHSKRGDLARELDGDRVKKIMHLANSAGNTPLAEAVINCSPYMISTLEEKGGVNVSEHLTINGESICEYLATECPKDATIALARRDWIRDNHDLWRKCARRFPDIYHEKMHAMLGNSTITDGQILKFINDAKDINSSYTQNSEQCYISLIISLHRQNIELSKSFCAFPDRMRWVSYMMAQCKDTAFMIEMFQHHFLVKNANRSEIAQISKDKYWRMVAYLVWDNMELKPSSIALDYADIEHPKRELKKSVLAGEERVKWNFRYGNYNNNRASLDARIEDGSLDSIFGVLIYALHQVSDPTDCMEQIARDLRLGCVLEIPDITTHPIAPCCWALATSFLVCMSLYGTKSTGFRDLLEVTRYCHEWSPGKIVKGIPEEQALDKACTFAQETAKMLKEFASTSETEECTPSTSLDEATNSAVLTPEKMLTHTTMASYDYFKQYVYGCNPNEEALSEYWTEIFQEVTEACTESCSAAVNKSIL